MKTLSSHAVSKEDLTAVDEKQTRQIMQLRMWTIANFIFTFAGLVGVFIFRNV